MDEVMINNFAQQIVAKLKLRPLGCECRKGCTNPEFWCEPGQVFTCCFCKKLTPYCKGCDDDLPDACDDCWVIYSHKNI